MNLPTNRLLTIKECFKACGRKFPFVVDFVGPTQTATGITIVSRSAQREEHSNRRIVWHMLGSHGTIPVLGAEKTAWKLNTTMQYPDQYRLFYAKGK